MEGRVEGIVVEANGDIVKVRIKQHGECSHCGSCGGDLALLVDARCPGGAPLGARVSVDMPEADGVKSAFVVYLLPLLGAAAGWLAGTPAAWLLNIPPLWPSTAFCAVGFILSMLYLLRYERMMAGRQELPPATLLDGNSDATKKRL